MRTGTANLPLHGGRCPAWLFTEMKKLAPAILRAVAYEYGPSEVLKRLSDPFWFQSFGCVLGFDWHSSGVTTTVCGAIKEGLRPYQNELGIFVAGGKGKTSRKTPQEIDEAGEKFGLNNDLEGLKYASRMAAKVDNNTVQDGYQIYHHFFLFTREGSWTVVQQGMNDETGYARRYHWLSEGVSSFVCEPHSGVACDSVQPALNLVARESEESRKAITLLAHESPEKNLQLVSRLNNSLRENLQPVNRFTAGPGQLSFSFNPTATGLSIAGPSLFMPKHHYVPNSVHIKKALEKAYLRQPESFETLVSQPGVGAGALRALALVAEVIHGVRPSYRDPARYSFAHGGKDGYPFPVDKDAYRNSVDCIEKALSKAKLGRTEKIRTFRRLSKIQAEAEL